MPGKLFITPEPPNRTSIAGRCERDEVDVAGPGNCQERRLVVGAQRGIFGRAQFQVVKLLSIRVMLPGVPSVIETVWTMFAEPSAE